MSKRFPGGNSTSFGNLTFSAERISGMSNCHGGL